MNKKQILFLVFSLIFTMSSCDTIDFQNTLAPTTSLERTNFPESTHPVVTSTVQATEISYPQVKETCSDEDHLRAGKFVAENNTWGRKDANGEPYEQCLSVTQLDTNRFEVSWSWNWPVGSGNVKAYPEIIFGNKFGLVSSDYTGLPAKVDQLSEYLIAYSYIEESVTGERNVAFESWLHSSDHILGTNRKYEVMVWLDRSAHFFSGGEYLGDVEIDGEMYELFSGPFPRWHYIAFVRKQSSVQGQLRWNSFVEYLLMNNIIEAENTYLADIEFGTEIISGSGRFIVNQIDIEVGE